MLVFKSMVMDLRQYIGFWSDQAFVAFLTLPAFCHPRYSVYNLPALSPHVPNCLENIRSCVFATNWSKGLGTTLCLIYATCRMNRKAVWLYNIPKLVWGG